MLRANESNRPLDTLAPRSLGQSEDSDQPYDRIRDARELPEDPGLTPALVRRDERCAMHRMKEQLTAGDIEDAGALSWIATMERAIAKGEARCRCSALSA